MAIANVVFNNQKSVIVYDEKGRIITNYCCAFSKDTKLVNFTATTITFQCKNCTTIYNEKIQPISKVQR